MTENQTTAPPKPPGLIDRIIRFFLEQKLVVFLMAIILIGWGVAVAPFDWETGPVPRAPVPTDAIPDIGENQQIVFTDWMGRSPQDVEDQVTYPLTVALLGVPGVKTIRSSSMFGFSSIYVIFEEKVEFYWSRSRVLEKLSSLPAGTLPEGVRPALGPDATPLGQIYWYTLEGRDEKGRPAGGWGLDELRSVQDWKVRYELAAVKGVSEVASVGGFVREYQVDIDPDALRAYGVSLEDVFNAVRMSNVDVGARTIEVNRAEYVIRGIGFVKEPADIANTAVKAREGVPVYIRSVAHVTLGPALRRGALDKGGAEAVGGVVVVRYGENPLATIKRVRQKIAEFAPSLPRKTLADGRVSRVTVVPFYDRTGLIKETLGTLERAVREEILVTIIVVLVMVLHLRSSALISGLLPLAVLMAFIAMKLGGVDANIVALSGIAIAIGTIVDMGIVVCENILKHLDEAPPGESRLEVVYRASAEVGGAVLTAIATTVVSFLPVFTMTGPEGKLFKPLAYTKTFALVASVVIALTMLPAFAHLLFTWKVPAGLPRRVFDGALLVLGAVTGIWLSWWAGAAIAAVGAYRLAERHLPKRVTRWSNLGANAFAVLVVVGVLTGHWLPLGPERGLIRNLVFVGGLLAVTLGSFRLFEMAYGRVLSWCLRHKLLFLSAPAVLLLAGACAWLGFDRLFGFMPGFVKRHQPYVALRHAFPGLGREFMPPLDEGSYLYMPTTMPHASIGEVLDVISRQDRAISAIPEVQSTVGKLGRAETPLDPAPVSMIETIINYLPEYKADDDGVRPRFRFSADQADFFRNEAGEPVPAPDGKPYLVKGKFERGADDALIPDPGGQPFRLWRPALDPRLNPGRDPWPGVRRPDDIWDDIVRAAEVPGTTGAPRLQPIAARLVMLQSGMRAPMGIKIKGADLRTIEKVGLDMERLLKTGAVPSVKTDTVIADRIVGKAYLELDWDREALDRHGVHIRKAQDVVEVAIGGRTLTTTVEGRERYPVRVRYLRELRDTVESLGKILVTASGGAQIPVGQLLEQQVVIDLDSRAAQEAGVSPLAAAGAIRRALVRAGIDEDDFQAGEALPFPVFVRRERDFNGRARALDGVVVAGTDGRQLPISGLLKLSYPRRPWYRRGPMVIKSEDTRLVGYVLFDMKPGNAEVDVVEAAQRYLKDQERVFERAWRERTAELGREPNAEELMGLPGLDLRGCTYAFAGSYENQIHSQRTLLVVLPLALFVIFLILYFQFRSVISTSLVFSGIMVAWAGGFILLWLYGQSWFLDFSIFGTDMRGLFQIHPVNLSVAVWVGFLALFGIATDDGVIMATYLGQSFEKARPGTVEEVRQAALAAGLRRVRPCLMTTATTVLALIPVLTSTGRGSDVMVPMAIPSFGGMTIEVITMLIVPVLYCFWQERKLRGSLVPRSESDASD